jgi:hypothetical protein
VIDQWSRYDKSVIMTAWEDGYEPFDGDNAPFVMTVYVIGIRKLSV